MDLSKAPAPHPAETQAETLPTVRWEAAEAVSPFAVNHAAIVASRGVLVRTIALLS